jgi:hypothetical protein
MVSTLLERKPESSTYQHSSVAAALPTLPVPGAQSTSVHHGRSSTKTNPCVGRPHWPGLATTADGPLADPWGLGASGGTVASVDRPKGQSMTCISARYRVPLQLGHRPPQTTAGAAHGGATHNREGGRYGAPPTPTRGTFLIRGAETAGGAHGSSFKGEWPGRAEGCWMGCWALKCVSRGAGGKLQHLVSC